VLLISLVTGLFKELITFLFIIIIHEIGHICASILFKWRIDKVSIMPFGCITIFRELINKPLVEEFIILIMGPLFQFIDYLIFKDITPYFNYYNYGLFIFNMLPIYPLDGYKLYSIILNKIIPFKYTLKIMLIISILSLTLFIKKDLIYIVILLLLLNGIIKEARNINFIYNKFLYERYRYNLYLKKRKIIKNINNMYKDKIHLIQTKDGLVTEKYFLEKRFKY
jgi:stage IV sporulation protein FB